MITATTWNINNMSWLFSKGGHLDDLAEAPVPEELEELDNILRCPICYKCIDIAMFFPQCSHTFKQQTHLVNQIAN